MTARRYGWIPDVPDHRDLLFAATRPPATLPVRVGRLGMGSPIEDQGQLGSCTGNASTSAVEIVTGVLALSRLMAYYNGRAREGTTAVDAGCQIRDVIKGLARLGCCDEAQWPYVITQFAVRPPTAAYDGAKTLLPLVAAYHRINGLAQIKAALADRLPVIFGFAVPEYFESTEIARDGWVRVPRWADRIIGGHAVCAVGYDDNPTDAPAPFVWVRNSWGAGWGVSGYCRFDQNWFDDRRLVDDMWVVHGAKQ